MNNVELQLKKAKDDYQQMMLVGYIFAIISTVLSSFAIISLAWTIPMTISINNKRKSFEPQECLALGILSLIFLSLIGGIFVIIASTYATSYQDIKMSAMPKPEQQSI